MKTRYAPTAEQAAAIADARRVWTEATDHRTSEVHAAHRREENLKREAGAMVCVFTDEGAFDGGRCYWVIDDAGRAYIVTDEDEFGFIYGHRYARTSGRLAGTQKRIALADVEPIAPIEPGPLGRHGVRRSAGEIRRISQAEAREIALGIEVAS